MKQKQFIQVQEYSSNFVLEKEKLFTDEEIKIIETEFKGKIDVVTRSGGKQEIITQQYVGYIVLPNHVISIRSKIQEVSFFNMVRYALFLPMLRYENFELSVANNYYDILVRFLLQELGQLLQRGLYTAYKDYEENLTCLRGKILFKEQIYINHSRHDKVFCSYGELSTDVKENRVIKKTLHYLSGCSFPDERINDQLIRYYRRLDEVELVPVTDDMISSIEFTPLNEHYRTILTLCELLLTDSSLGEERIGEKTAISFLIDMNRLFEQFVANLLVEKLKEFQIEKQKMIHPKDNGVGRKVVLDLLISRSGRPALILDTKYQEYAKDPKDEHVYQLYYYCNRKNVKNCCLIYPGHELFKEYPQDNEIMLYVVLFDLTASDTRQFEEKCDKFVDTILKILGPICQ